MNFIKNDLNLCFCIWEYEDITHEEISRKLNLSPRKVYVKGEKIPPPFYSYFTK